MKTIEWLAADKYISQSNLPVHKQIPAKNYIDWANFGAREAQRWIPLDEELPPDAVQVLVELQVELDTHTFEMVSLGSYHSFNKNWNIIHTNIDIRGDVKGWKVVRWRLIERD